MLRSVASRRASSVRSFAERLFATPATSFGAVVEPSALAAPAAMAPAQGSPVRAMSGSLVVPFAAKPCASPTATSPAREISTTTSNLAVYDVGSSTNIKWHEAKVSKDDRQKLLGQRGCVLWMTGLSGSGKSTLAYTLEHALMEKGRITVVLDGDNIRHGLNKNLGFSAADREENIRRVGEVAKLFADAGIITIVSFISPYSKDRAAARALLEAGSFIEVYMKIPLAVCEQRDPKGLYKKARSGQLKGFTGIDDPYEEPEAAELVIEVSKDDGVLQPPEKMALQMIKFLEEKGILSGST
eukprot:TRINITY_DN16500_c0_g3_i1.p1 TRINITY_DN16500_c0_g3~~TRINITY_DN16500_c0_g3_i1.p1  ORF type:complete len:299 (-),score=31.16 TRINITY_DN16500_c0_g3_i1:87-983(-)